ncbi:MAG: glycolate oxidase subunit GlcF [Magnetovibrionaceae bacterium]
MQTHFTLAQLADPKIKDVDSILRNCVHCGFCTATCPTYTLLGDELDSPRGRIYLIKDMFENNKPGTEKVAKHIDRCLSCLSCMTTCPSGVHYMHLVDEARTHIENTYDRPWHDKALREVLAFLLPKPGLFRAALIGAKIASPFARFFKGHLALERFGAMLRLAPKKMKQPSPMDRPQTFPAAGPRKQRVALLNGCAQQVLEPGINESTIRLLARHGVEVVIPKGLGCCGALTHHMGKEEIALEAARNNVAAFWNEMQGEGLDAVIINASGCGTTVKDYGHMLRLDEDWRDKAEAVSTITRDITEFMTDLGLGTVVQGPAVGSRPLVVAYHSACSMQHGQKITTLPKALLAAAGFTVRDVPEGHLCCGSAGTYNIMQPEIASQLRDRKVANIESLKPDLIATGNIGCMAQIGSATGIPIVHTAALLDWATGGPLPEQLDGMSLKLTSDMREAAE